MLEILEFIFSSFWVYSGVILLILALGVAINAAFIVMWLK